MSKNILDRKAPTTCRPTTGIFSADILTDYIPVLGIAVAATPAL